MNLRTCPLRFGPKSVMSAVTADETCKNLTVTMPVTTSLTSLQQYTDPTPRLLLSLLNILNDIHPTNIKIEITPKSAHNFKPIILIQSSKISLSLNQMYILSLNILTSFGVISSNTLDTAVIKVTH